MGGGSCILDVDLISLIVERQWSAGARICKLTVGCDEEKPRQGQKTSVVDYGGNGGIAKSDSSRSIKLVKKHMLVNVFMHSSSKSAFFFKGRFLSFLKETKEIVGLPIHVDDSISLRRLLWSLQICIKEQAIQQLNLFYFIFFYE